MQGMQMALLRNGMSRAQTVLCTLKSRRPKSRRRTDLATCGSFKSLASTFSLETLKEKFVSGTRILALWSSSSTNLKQMFQLLKSVIKMKAFMRLVLTPGSLASSSTLRRMIGCSRLFIGASLTILNRWLCSHQTAYCQAVSPPISASTSFKMAASKTNSARTPSSRSWPRK